MAGEETIAPATIVGHNVNVQHDKRRVARTIAGYKWLEDAGSYLVGQQDAERQGCDDDQNVFHLATAYDHIQEHGGCGNPCHRACDAEGKGIKP